jgi:hypothetical protein
MDWVYYIKIKVIHANRGYKFLHKVSLKIKPVVKVSTKKCKITTNHGFLE